MNIKAMVVSAALVACAVTVPAGKVEAHGPDSEPPSTYVRVIGRSREQCVVYVQRMTGSRKVRGYAGNVRAEGSVPRVGAAALDRKYGHVALVVAIDGDYLILHDANWRPGYVTERRVNKNTQRGYVYFN